MNPEKRDIYEELRHERLRPVEQVDIENRQAVDKLNFIDDEHYD